MIPSAKDIVDDVNNVHYGSTKTGKTMVTPTDTPYRAISALLHEAERKVVEAMEVARAHRLRPTVLEVLSITQVSLFAQRNAALEDANKNNEPI